MNEEIKQEIVKNFTKVNDFIMEATKRELSKTCQDGRFLDHSLYALVAKHDVEQEFEKLKLSNLSTRSCQTSLQRNRL